MYGMSYAMRFSVVHKGAGVKQISDIFLYTYTP